MFKTFVSGIKMMWMGAETLGLKIRLGITVLCGLLCGATAYFSSFYLSQLVNAVQSNDPNIMRYCIYFIVLSIGLVVVRFVCRYFTEFIGVIITNNLRRHYYRQMFYKDYAWHTHNSVGFFSSMLDRVCNRINTWNWQMPYDYLPGLTVILLFLGYTFTVSNWLFIYFLVCIVVMIAGVRISLIYRKKLERGRIVLNRDYTKVFLDFMYNIRTIKKMNLLRFTTDKINRKAKRFEEKNSQVFRYNAWQWCFMELFVRAQFLVPLTYFIIQLVRTGNGLDVIVMLVSVQAQMGEIGRQIMHFMSDLIMTQQEFALMTEHLGVGKKSVDRRPAPRTWRSIVFDKTQFEFNDSNDTDFTHCIHSMVINRGDHIAVMGRSGEGKSTFLNLLTRQYLPQSGSITVDGVPYADMPQRFFDDNITYVSQDIELFDMSLYDNITMGRRVSARDMKKIINGCCLNELVARLNGNLNADIGEKGVKVSGGEKQRINLARGLLLGRDILVLDEITANLDPETTRKIWQFVFDNYSDRTIIAISHEPELVRHVNKRLVFKSGRGRCA